MTTEDIQALPPLNSTEREWLKDMLDRLGDVLACAGCNDFGVTVTTEEARATLSAAMGGVDNSESRDFYRDRIAALRLGERVTVQDFMILAHLRERLGVD